MIRRRSFRTTRQSDRVAVPEPCPRGRGLCRLHARVSDVQPHARRAVVPFVVASVCAHVLAGVYPCILPPSTAFSRLMRTGPSELTARSGAAQAARRNRPSRLRAKYDRALASLLPAVAAAAGTAAAVATTVAGAEARLARLGLVYLDVAALEFAIVELTNRIGDFLRGRHFDKAKALGLSGKLIRDDRGALHLTNLREQFVKVVVGD